MAHKGHAANKKDALQTKHERSKQKREPLQTKKTGALQTKMETAAKKKDLLQTKNDRCKQKREPLQIKKTGALQTKKKSKKRKDEKRIC